MIDRRTGGQPGRLGDSRSDIVVAEIKLLELSEKYEINS